MPPARHASTDPPSRRSRLGRGPLACGSLLCAWLALGACAAVTPGGTPRDGGRDTGTGGGSDGGVAVDLGGPCVDGGGCTTGDPGACGMGLLVCDSSGGAVCTHQYTTQACYSGTPGTQGLGACKEGQQTCTGGALGPCTGEVLPAALEDCYNDADDDCDGVVNDGCPDQITLGTPRLLGIHGGSGGAAGSLRCPAAQHAFVVRSEFYFDSANSRVSGIGIHCARATLVRGVGMYTVTTAKIAPAPFLRLYGSVAGFSYKPGDLDCWSPDGNPGTATSITGLTSAMAVLGDVASSEVIGIGMRCGVASFTLQADNSLTATITHNEMSDNWNYWTYAAAGVPLGFDDRCNASEVLVGYDLRLSGGMIRVQGVCAPIVVTKK